MIYVSGLLKGDKKQDPDTKKRKADQQVKKHLLVLSVDSVEKPGECVGHCGGPGLQILGEGGSEGLKLTVGIKAGGGTGPTLATHHHFLHI